MSDNPAIYSVWFKGAGRQNYAVDEDGIKYVKRDVLAFKGRCVVRASRNEFFGGKKAKDFQSGVLVDPTWDDLYRVFGQQIRRTNDFHHTFLEGARKIGSEKINGEDVTIIELSMGS